LINAQRSVDVNEHSSSAAQVEVNDREQSAAHLRGQIIPILQRLQERSGFISEEQVDEVAAATGVSASSVYGVATFYSQFRLQPPGRHMIRVCEGTACHVLGAKAVLEALKMNLGIDVDQTTSDGLFSLESVRCLGCCSLAPAVVIDDETYGRVSPNKIGGILDTYRKESA
jgi:NADH-quinone oxidoreductase subunit E